MDLIASYGSSDEDDDHQQRGQHHHHHQRQTELPHSTSLFSSLPQPKSMFMSSSSSSSLFSSLPPPKSSSPSPDDVGPPSSSSHLFSTLPKLATSSSAPSKRIVHITPPLPPPKFLDDDDEEEEEEEEEERKRRRASQTAAQAPSVRSFLSSIPLPRHSSTLGASSSFSGSGRRSIVETEVEAAPPSPIVHNPPAVEVESGSDAYTGSQFSGVPSYVDGAAYQETYPVAYEEAGNGGDAGVPSDSVYYQGGVGSYWGSSEYAAIGDVRKRGRKEANVEIVEVKQDELMKNRPREDQMKLTGIAFGPSHQPASTKGKPSKLHKRKHQIGSLYFDMKQKETELQERRSRGLLTKSQTQGKYGW